MEKIKIGDEVVVFKRPRNRTRHDSSVMSYPATVTKVGRKYAAAEYEVDGRFKQVIEFDMSTGNERDTSTNYGDYVRTPEQARLDSRRAEALAAIKAHHIEFKTGRERSFTLEQLEALAEVVKTFDGEVSQ